MNYNKSIFDNLPLPCILLEKKKDRFVIKKANKSYCRLTNINSNTLRGKLIQEVFPENPFFSGLKEVQQSLETAYNTKEPNKINSLRYDLFDKIKGVYEIKYWETENIPIFDEKHHTWYVLNLVKDITKEILEKNRSEMLKLELEIQSENYEQLLVGIGDGLFSLDLNSNFISINKGITDIVGSSEIDLLEMNFFSFLGESNRGKNEKNFYAALGGIHQKFEVTFLSGDGKKTILDISLVPLTNDGMVAGLYGFAKDITLLKESEFALLKSERKFKALVQEGSDLIGILDLEGKYKFVSETSTSVLGIPPKDFIGKVAFDFVHPEDKERLMISFAELEVKGQVQIKPFRFKNSQGEWRWIETNATNLINDPAIGGIVTNSRDVTDHINSQKAIIESEERYRSFFENSMDAIMVTVPDGRILAANPSACKMFQRSEKEICELGREAITYAEDPGLAEALILREKNGTVTTELFFIRKDGTKFPGEITSSIFKDSEGNSRSSVIIRDITQRKKIENNLLELNENLKKNTQELIRAIKGLEQFSYIISHNLRAPVANILGLTHLLNEKGYSEEIRMKLRGEIESNAYRMDKVIKDLNQVLQIKHDFSEAKESIDLNEIVNSIKMSLADLIKKEKINIITDFREVDKIKSISSFIHSIFYNLIFNSIKFRQSGIDPVLKITSKRKNGMICFVFEDNGLGVDLTKKKDQIFGLYKRFHLHVEGKGMGLFMVKTQVEMLGGKISLASRVNVGTKFIIEFPDQDLN